MVTLCFSSFFRVATTVVSVGETIFSMQVKPSLGCLFACVGVYLLAFFVSVDFVSSVTWPSKGEVQNRYYGLQEKPCGKDSLPKSKE